ncbi:hypothetical protein ACFFU9_14840 [Mariniflexile ostreae]|uniref:Outer membrane protein beta-barrel domain-containing protein n=1 Tax=Mariniflexile ostreae TaxID=1520892 RepID=A0ABV5FF09_9FLAO
MKITIAKQTLFCITVLLGLQSFGQEQEALKYTASNKGKFSVSWGGNRASFSKSNIDFKGSDYNFRLLNVKAHDKPKGWHIDYINPERLTIPQTNFKIGYFISDHYKIAIGLDHMKYVVSQLQTVHINGNINLNATDAGAIYNGMYTDDTIFINEDFLLFEHTDGLNYVYLDVSRFDDISSIFNIRNTDKFQLNLTEGIGGGFLLPKTNTTLMQKDRYDEFHLSGYGVSLNAGLNLTFFKHFFMQLNMKGGFINMPNIKTTNSKADSASQHFFFLERVIEFGGIFNI